MYFLFDSKNFGQITWKTIVALLFIIVAFFAIFGLIGKAIELIMHRQARKVDKFMSPLIISGLIDDDKVFKETAFKKVRIYFFKSSIIPVFLMIASLLMYVIYHSIDGNWSESIFDDVTGIGTLFYTWDFSEAEYYFPLGFGGVKLQNVPHFLTTVQCINYFIFLFGFIGIVWYLFNVQGYIAQSYRIKKLADKMFSQDLDKVDLSTLFNTETNSNSLESINKNTNN